MTATTQEQELSMPPLISLGTLPMEIMDSILAHLTQHDLTKMIRLSRDFSKLIAKRLYHTPFFVSTYRFVQFARTVVDNSSYASLVRILDTTSFQQNHPYHSSSSPRSSAFFGISDDEEGRNSELTTPDTAGWRELQYIDRDMYYLYHRTRAAPPFDYSKAPPNRQSMVSFRTMRDMERRGCLGMGMWNPLGSFMKSTHPPPSPVLQTHRKNKDVPIGAVCRILISCKNIIKIDFSDLHLAGDYLVLPTSPPSPSSPQRFSSLYSQNDYYSLPPSPSLLPPTLQQGNTQVSHPTAHLTSTDQFWTDAPPPYPSWMNMVPVYADDVVYHISKLQHLKTLSTRRCSWMSVARAWKALGENGLEEGEERERKLEEVDFRRCGMMNCSDWALKGDSEVVKAVVRDVLSKNEARGA